MTSDEIRKRIEDSVDFYAPRESIEALHSKLEMLIDIVCELNEGSKPQKDEISLDEVDAHWTHRVFDDVIKDGSISEKELEVFSLDSKN